MSEQASKTTGRKSGRAGLGRGLGALIPQARDQGAVSSTQSTSNPLDVFFPERAAGEQRARGGSARDLLQPKPKKAGSSPRGTKVAKAAGESTSAAASSGAHGESASRVSVATSRKKTQRDAATSSSGRKTGPSDVQSSSEVRGEVSDTGATGAALEAQSNATQKLDALTTFGQEMKAEDSTGTGAKELFADVLEGDVSRETSQDLLPVPGAAFAEIPIEYIVANSRQPREIFDEDDLAELAASIAEVGVLQPVVVRPINPDEEPSDRLKQYLAEKPEARFELIMGERRTRASELAGETTIPAIIRSTEDEDLLRDALLENLHRAQLNPLEEASAYQQLMADFGATQEELSKRIARSRPQIANTLRLLKLPPAVQKKVAAQVISAGHARALLSLKRPEDMERLAERIVAEGLSVRTTEELVRLGRVKAAQKPRTRTSAKVSELGESVATAFQDVYETRVTITEGRTKGKIVIEFAGAEDLRRIADVLASMRK